MAKKNIAIFGYKHEHKNEDKSCSACPEDQLKPFKFLKISNFSNFQIFKFFKFLKKFPGSQLLSDVQTFFIMYTKQQQTVRNYFNVKFYKTVGWPCLVFSDGGSLALR